MGEQARHRRRFRPLRVTHRGVIRARGTNQVGALNMVIESASTPGERPRRGPDREGPPALGATEALVAAAEAELGIRFPDELREAWKTCNCNEVGGWRIFPVFDPANPRKTCGSVTYENLRGAWGQEVMAKGLVSIGANGTGNQLVLKVESGRAGSQVFRWHHATGRLAPWKPGIAAIAASAARSREFVLGRLRASGHAGSRPGNTGI